MNLRCLVVEDDKYFLDAITDILSLHGLEVTAASSGNMAVELIRNQNYDVIISDVRMPNGDGKYLFRSVNELFHPDERPLLIACTGFNDLTEEEAHSLGVFHLLTKPFSVDQLLNTLAEAFPKELSA